jgi:hypothetical protein
MNRSTETDKCAEILDSIVEEIMKTKQDVDENLETSLPIALPKQGFFCVLIS